MKNPITRDKFKAVLFDLDGVLTTTEKIHFSCWKKMFDDFLLSYSDTNKIKFVPFDINQDYLKYVDGKPRYEGVRDFLASRTIDIPQGSHNSPPDEISVCGLGNRKNELFNQTVKNEPVELYESSINLVRHLKSEGFKLAVVSSSRNCKAVLASAGIQNLFEVVVDGITAEKLGLSGKPRPDTYIEASKTLDIDPKSAVVVEDASSGVKAGKNGNFGLVIGIARKENSNELKINGADIVVKDLKEIEF
ncbi:MAG: HAD family hydrolase [Thermodesulfobacteriota bacterium]